MDGLNSPAYLGLPTRWEFDGAGIEFRLWTLPVIERGIPTAMTLVWKFGDGTMGKRRCGGFMEATEYASRVVGMAGASVRLTS